MENTKNKGREYLDGITTHKNADGYIRKEIAYAAVNLVYQDLLKLSKKLEKLKVNVD